MSEIKLCIDCKHCGRDSDNVWKELKCNAPQNIVEYPNRSYHIDGGTRMFKKRRHQDALDCRDYGWLAARLERACGMEARWFEPKV